MEQLIEAIDDLLSKIERILTNDLSSANVVETSEWTVLTDGGAAQ